MRQASFSSGNYGLMLHITEYFHQFINTYFFSTLMSVLYLSYKILAFVNPFYYHIPL